MVVVGVVLGLTAASPMDLGSGQYRENFQPGDEEDILREKTHNI